MFASFYFSGIISVCKKNTFAILFSFVLIPACIYSQDITGDIEGQITDDKGKSISGVNFYLLSTSLQGSRGTASNDKGYFRFISLPVGEYTVKISAVGFSVLNIENVIVQLGKTTNLGEIVLKKQAISLPEITVSGKKPIIDPVSTTYGGNINSVDFQQLPIDRNYRNMITLLPQVNTSYYGDEANIGGATGSENKYFVDGVEVTDPFVGKDATNLPYNFIKEIEVKSGGYNVDSRSALGGLINVITYSGSNEFHGSVFGFYTSNQLSENGKLSSSDVTHGDFSNYDIGFGLGGPVILDKLWFYAAYNPTFNRRDVEVPNFGTYVDQTLTHSFALKLNWRVSDDLNFIFTTTGDPTQQDAVGNGIVATPTTLVNPDPYLKNITQGGVNYSLNGTYIISENISLQGSVSRVDRHDTGEPSTEKGYEALFVNQVNDVWSGGVGGGWDSFRHSVIGKISGTFLLNKHILNAGLEYKTNGVTDKYDWHNINGFDTIYYEYIGNGLTEIQNRIPSVFIQDSWRVFEKLNLTAGIRWDGHYIVDSNGELLQTISVPLQPRIGIVYLLDDDNTQRIYGSFGRFQQEYGLHPSGYFSNHRSEYEIHFFRDPRINNTGGDTVRNIQQHILNPEINNLLAQYYDEFSIGYERSIGWNIKAGVQGVFRTLREAIEDVWFPEEETYRFGNPGSGILSEWPKPRRDYNALIVTIERSGDEHFNFLASYVLSRDYGNYEGLFSAYNYNESFPNANVTFDELVTSRVNATGLVPNDRTHVFKFSGYYNFSIGLITGFSFIAQSGTPLSEFDFTGHSIKFVSPRGSAGRTPTIWDLNARIMYNLDFLSNWHSKLILDLFHIASQEKPVDINQVKYLFGFEYQYYGQVYRYQPSMSVRLGMEVSF